jgi:hypothetical protein
MHGQLHASAALPPREESPMSIGQEVAWASVSVWTLWRRESHYLCRESNPDSKVAR